MVHAVKFPMHAKGDELTNNNAVITTFGAQALKLKHRIAELSSHDSLPVASLDRTHTAY